MVLRKNLGLLLALVLLCLGGLAQATISIETVRVGDAGNQADTEVMQDGTTGYGSVGYTYNIGKYEVTAAQYTAFLNAVAADDTYGLYNTSMWDYEWSPKIQRSGSSGSYSYSVAADYANRPVNCVSFWNACRFANWLHNGQPTGPQGASTTEDGAYAINGYNGTFGQSIVRKPGAKWFIPSENEWYKAAYYKGHGTNAGYYDYPTSSDVIPGRDLNDPNGNNANHYDYSATGTYPIDNGKFSTVVGQFRNSPSPYGTFDQGGNVGEWNEAIPYQDSISAKRGYSGGNWTMPCDTDVGLTQRASHRNYSYPAGTNGPLGFRVASADIGPKITSVTPNSGKVNTTSSLQILGQNFFPGLTVRLTKQGQSDIMSNSTYINPAEIDCTLDLTNAGGGLWNVAIMDATGLCGMLANGYTVLGNTSSAKRGANLASTVIDCIVTYVVSTGQFYVESDDRSSGMLVSKTAHGMSLGQRMTATGTARTSATGEKYILATVVTPSGGGTIEPIALSNKAIGGGDWFYDSGSGAGQKGIAEYRRVTAGGSLQLLECPGMNNVGLLITTFGKVTYSAGTYFYIDDGSGCRDNSAYVGIKVLGAVPVQQGENPVGKYVKVTGIASCFKGAVPDTSLYRQVRAREVTIIH